MRNAVEGFSPMPTNGAWQKVSGYFSRQRQNSLDASEVSSNSMSIGMDVSVTPEVVPEPIDQMHALWQSCCDSNVFVGKTAPMYEVTLAFEGKSVDAETGGDGLRHDVVDSCLVECREQAGHLWFGLVCARLQKTRQQISSRRQDALSST